MCSVPRVIPSLHLTEENNQIKQVDFLLACQRNGDYIDIIIHVVAEINLDGLVTENFASPNTPNSLTANDNTLSMTPTSPITWRDNWLQKIDVSHKYCYLNLTMTE